jgi:F0F1-type ATP synthase assembly protein I
LIGLQLMAGVAVAAGFFVIKGSWEALSAGYGGLVSVLMTMLLSRGVLRAGRVASQSPGRSQALLYLGAAVRFVLVLALFGIGLARLGLAPLATVIGFVLVQLMLPISAIQPQQNK